MVSRSRVWADSVGDVVGLVGCQRVPAAFYRLDEGQGNATSFRFNYSSLRDSDAPKSTGDWKYKPADAVTDATYVDPVYSDLHDLCNTSCWVNGEGSTMPDQLASRVPAIRRAHTEPATGTAERVR